MELAPIALLAGLISITSPCCLPLIPGYLSYMSGVTAGADGQKGRVLGASSLFVLGFASIFTALGASASLAGAVLLGALPVLVKVAGVFVILMGLAMLGILRLPVTAQLVSGTATLGSQAPVWVHRSVSSWSARRPCFAPVPR
ncbi:MAG: cytochrome c biogenesis CcdA family protein [Candidatus Methylomirabilaceae bacterium]